jgi:alcohol dehydrogenase class IV
MAELGRILTGNPEAGPEEAAAWLDALAEELMVPPLTTYAVDLSTFPEIAEKASKASSMKGNPVALTPDELIAILNQAM